LKFWLIVVPERVAAPVLVTPVKVSLAEIVRIGGRVIFPIVVMPTGKDPGSVAELVAKVVEPVPVVVAVAVLVPGPLIPKLRIMAALVVLASENAATNAKLRVALMSLRKAVSSIDEHQGAFRK